MKVGVIGAGTMGQGIAKAFAQTEGFTVVFLLIFSILCKKSIVNKFHLFLDFSVS